MALALSGQDSATVLDDLHRLSCLDRLSLISTVPYRLPYRLDDFKSKIRRLGTTLIFTHPLHTAQVLLGVLDDARSTDSQGRTVSFKNTIIIMTSNVGQKEVLDSLRRNTSKGKQIDMALRT